MLLLIYCGKTLRVNLWRKNNIHYSWVRVLIILLTKKNFFSFSVQIFLHDWKNKFYFTQYEQIKKKIEMCLKMHAKIYSIQHWIIVEGWNLPVFSIDFWIGEVLKQQQWKRLLAPHRKEKSRITKNEEEKIYPSLYFRQLTKRTLWRKSREYRRIAGERGCILTQYSLLLSLMISTCLRDSYTH